jgi:extracellular factor (EF) 3-hydroxypalmitic acid methyl ester biosynthesis protein
MSISTGKDTFIICRNSQGTEFRATLLRLTRYMVVFEVYNPYSILQLSEVLTDFRMIMNDRMIYSGRAIVSNLVNTGILLVCEATLEDSWLDVDLFSTLSQKNRLQTEFTEFLQEWEKIYRVVPEFKVVVADIQTLLSDLRRWLEQVELSIRSEPTGNRNEIERNVINELQKPILKATSSLFGRFEETASRVEEDLQPIHRAYVKRQIHPLVLCSPFIYRTFQKPLGYAGDYEMVNMILRDPHEGSSLFAKILNLYILSQAPAEAHRNRVQYLNECLREETLRMIRHGKTSKIFNLGCGPAGEVQKFLDDDDLCEKAELTLLDFNEETLAHTRQILEGLKMRKQRSTRIEMFKKSVNQILKETLKAPNESETKKYDLIYCAGLFDYLSDRICKRLMNIFYEVLAPGGLLVATNVDASNPIRNLMEYILEWHLVYRNSEQLKQLKPDDALSGNFTVKSDSTGVNIYIEVRKPCA